MPITQELVTIASCDICGKDINVGNAENGGSGYVSAMVYGAAFHHECLTKDMILILKAIELDDITLINNRGEHEKLIYSRLAKDKMS